MSVEHEISSTKLQKEENLMNSILIKNSHALESAHNRDFKKLLLEAVDEGLSSLGDSQKQAIYFYLEKTFTVKKKDIPNKIEEFANAIEKIFGNGAKILEIQIMKHLYEKVGPDFEYFPEKDDLLFTEYVEAASMYVHTRRVKLETRNALSF